LVSGSAKESSNGWTYFYKTISNDVSPSTLTSFNSSLQHVSLLTNVHSFLISTLTLSILLFICKPTLILNSTQLLSLSLFNY
jgi:NADH-ubiquinone oxidoreductase chain 2